LANFVDGTKKWKKMRFQARRVAPWVAEDFVLTDFVLTDFVLTDFVLTDFVLTDFVLTDFVLTDFVLTNFVLTDFVLTDFVLTDFVLTVFVVTVFFTSEVFWGSATPCASPPPWPSIFSDYSLWVHPPATRDDRHLLAHAMASDFSVAWLLHPSLLYPLFYSTL
jgi:hypothetical protein